MNKQDLRSYFEQYRQAQTEEDKKVLWNEIRQVVAQESVSQRKEGVLAVKQRLGEICELLHIDKLTQ